jgi:hypothetical protein
VRHATDEAALRRLWCQWTEVVEQCARRRRGGLSERQYARLHADLLAACRALAGAAGGNRRALYERLLELARPWLRLRVLEHEDRDILQDLCRRCRQAERELGVRRWRVSPRACAGPALVLAAGAGVFLIVRTADRPLFPLAAWAKGWTVVARWDATRPGAAPGLLLAAVVVTLVAIYLVSRAARG